MLQPPQSDLPQKCASGMRNPNSNSTYKERFDKKENNEIIFNNLTNFKLKSQYKPCHGSRTFWGAPAIFAAPATLSTALASSSLTLSCAIAPLWKNIENRTKKFRTAKSTTRPALPVLGCSQSLYFDPFPKAVLGCKRWEAVI